jgi:N-acetylglucosamine kinase-like BadF-type ATPase
MKRLYLGIDGGQSSTKALLADDTGLVIGRGHGGPCNHAGSAEGRAKFLSAVGDCLREAFHAAGIDPNSAHFASVCLGLSGGSEDKEVYAKELIRSDRYKFTHDAEIALLGGTGGQPGIIVIAGTGSISFGRNAQMRTARAGGWGYIFGDEGGGFDLARRALRCALQYEEGWGAPTALHQALLEVSGAATAHALLHHFYNHFDRKKIAAYAKLVTDAATHGDSVAMDVLNAASEQLSRYVTGVHRQLFTGSEAVPIVYVGGVFRSDILLATFKRSISSKIACPVASPLFSPAAGALLEALRQDGNSSPLAGLLPAD